MDLQIIAVMRAFPQYTRAALMEEEAGFFQRMQIVLAEEAKQQQAERHRANRRR